uniref:Uncharacterized protein n=1 Tax=Anguilla anguilla TaxID=7936 RepID=A0A0E9Q5T5_ANGAN
MILQNCQVSNALKCLNFFNTFHFHLMVRSIDAFNSLMFKEKSVFEIYNRRS